LDNAPASAEYCTHLLSLNGEESDLVKSFRGSTSRNARKAERAGVEIAFGHSREDVAAFFSLHCRTRKHHGIPPQPLSFFEKVHEHIIAPQKGFVALASHQGRPVAGAVYFLHRQRALYKFGASDRSFLHLRANNLVMREAIRWFSNNHFCSLHFGRTDLGQKGLAQFKNGWRADNDRVAYYRFDLKRNSFAGSRAYAQSSYGVFKLTPTPLLRTVGNLLYKHFG
jgi:lipid II:glycine glycyltransferase (peptidoglycan interpeptide bridge formation enzyme)